eukprot:gnl/TRDRNA2_/TRDRNA2_177247_c6_seq14.p1 gnl/TRDRNA2_/TRDRNA2_177247_c6~~gnl/TRDRNA2_/TRDRNA2_177247_c6_seq14.p1  ORF type:complete len:259 (+),score=68.77 gnl/TRDRNA2_/TRDRNA2_177247_c6_seq14:72-848(+)
MLLAGVSAGTAGAFSALSGLAGFAGGAVVVRGRSSGAPSQPANDVSAGADTVFKKVGDGLIAEAEQPSGSELANADRESHKGESWEQERSELKAELETMREQLVALAEASAAVPDHCSLELELETARQKATQAESDKAVAAAVRLELEKEVQGQKQKLATVEAERDALIWALENADQEMRRLNDGTEGEIDAQAASAAANAAREQLLIAELEATQKRLAQSEEELKDVQKQLAAAQNIRSQMVMTPRGNRRIPMPSVP